MTAGELIAQVDRLRHNQYCAEEKLQWLRRLDGQIRRELDGTHEPQGAQPNGADEPYTEDTVLRVGFPYDTELYTAYLFSQIDLHNGEIGKYNQSLALFQSAWRSLADHLNRTRRPCGAAAWRL